MPRIFTHRFAVPPAAIDALGHVNNLQYIAWMQEVAIQHSTAQGWPLERYLQEGTGWVVRAHRIEYKRPAYLGEAITLFTWVAGFSQRSSPRRYLFRRDADGAVLAEAETAWVYVDLASGRPRTVPPELRDAFQVVADDEAKAAVEG